MIDQYRVRQMSRMAMLESEVGKNVIKICSYRRADYVIMQIIKGFFLGTVCFAAILTLVFCFLWDDLNTFFADAQYMEYARQILMGYIVFMAVYLVICALAAIHRYNRYGELRNQYLRYLNSLGRSYEADRRRHRRKRKK
ncbi:MAG: hypothetical protein LUF32_09590 [Clostridiales bacterium]|nr:hypothetical protein [Clostridiales bacterium]